MVSQRKLFGPTTCFEGLYLKPGKHSIEFRYEPIYLYIGGGISILGLLTLLFVCLKALKSE